MLIISTGLATSLRANISCYDGTRILGAILASTHSTSKRYTTNCMQF